MIPADARNRIAKLVGESLLLDRPEDLKLYEYDGGVDKSRPEMVVFPRSASDVVAILAIAREHNIPIVGRGAGTGIAGAESHEARVGTDQRLCGRLPRERGVAAGAEGRKVRDRGGRARGIEAKYQMECRVLVDVSRRDAGGRQGVPLQVRHLTTVRLAHPCVPDQHPTSLRSIPLTPSIRVT